MDERTGQDIFKTLKTEARRIARRAGKSAAAAAVHYSGVRTLLSALQRHRAGGRRVLVLSYHRVVGDLAAEPLRTLPTLNISQKTFRRQLEQLLETHDIVTIDEALAVLAGMERARRDVAVITFDDGYRDVFDWAFPAMRELNVTGVSYVPSSFVGTRKRLGHDRLWPVLQRMSAQAIDPSSLRLSAQDEKWLRAAYAGSVPPNKALERLIAVHATAALYELADALEERLGMGAAPVSEGQLTMSWGMLRELAAAGWEIGAHTADHTVLTNQPLDEARRATSSAVMRATSSSSLLAASAVTAAVNARMIPLANTDDHPTSAWRCSAASQAQAIPAVKKIIEGRKVNEASTTRSTNAPRDHPATPAGCGESGRLRRCRAKTMSTSSDGAADAITRKRPSRRCPSTRKSAMTA
ncbi:MAG TPA: hypothetical protein VN874_05660 [Myxococcales bacterium]|nr:hypothetical protein [Myxococcales bacterium]